VNTGRALGAIRRDAGLTLRELGARAGTSHATLSAYESGRVDPSTATFDRVVRAAGFSVEVFTPRRIRAEGGLARGDELVAVLDLAEQFPARHADRWQAPVFARAA